MTKTRKRRLFSLISALAVLFSFSTANNLYAYSIEENELPSEKLDCDHIEILPDGGKIYVYSIDGVENKFPVPPENFTPLTATDEQLETYGFPPRPDEENQEDYEKWAELMGNYKFTLPPEVEISKEAAEDSESASLCSTDSLRDPLGTGVAGYTSTTSGSKYYTMVQTDIVYPKITTKETYSRDSFWIGMGRADYKKAVCAGFTTTVRKSEAQKNYAWYGYRLENFYYKMEVRIPEFTVNAGDNIHIYFSFQKANNKLNYYFANNTTGQTASAVIENVSASTYFDGSKVSWVIERISRENESGFYPLGDFGTVTFKNCKAMLSNSTSWKNLGSLENLQANEMLPYDEGMPARIELGNIVNSNQFSCTWYNS